MENWRDTLLSQYANGPTITALIEDFNEWLDPSVNIALFREKVWDVLTADDYGLYVWGKIVNVSRILQVQETSTYFGFDEAFTEPTADTGVQPFDQAPLYNGPPATTSYELSKEAYRTLILVKAMSNISNCSIPSINRMLQFLFAGEGRCYVQDTGDMTERFVFEFQLSPVQLAIMLHSGVISRPAGVKAFVMSYDAAGTFGFAEAHGQPFGQGTFFNSSQLQPTT
jgi:hypothetical protein